MPSNANTGCYNLLKLFLLCYNSGDLFQTTDWIINNAAFFCVRMVHGKRYFWRRESMAVCAVEGTCMIWLTWLGIRDQECISSRDMAPKETPLTWIACFSRCSIMVTFNLSSARKKKPKHYVLWNSVNWMIHVFLGIFMWWNNKMMGNLSFKKKNVSCTFRFAFRGQIPSVRWSPLERRAGMWRGMVALKCVYCNEKQTEGTLSCYCCAQVCFGFPSHP